MKGLVDLEMGGACGCLALELLSAVPAMDSYYRVPYTCEALQCAHGMKTAPDGRLHCAKHPPKDIKLSDVPMSRVRFYQAMVTLCSGLGLGFAVMTALFGAQWLRTRSAQGSPTKRRIWFRFAAPFGALLLRVCAAPFLWPDGFIPM
jgi:hypothetical protein